MIDLHRMSGRDGGVWHTALELMKLMRRIVVNVAMMHVLGVGALRCWRCGADRECTGR